ncbi:hypothetical protein [Aliarcobacter butzleri]|uniref:hypothetical protein n=1 Tax=Aliarcobacter butzleri TaxID=28197 RepID=UPI0018A06157|nr:hypothetical protein [Aliarcobacter butzleri]MBF7071694.1 hypothetical protein [Aliarcobacter butzleri]
MTHSLLMAKLCQISENSYFRWKKKDHSKLIDLVETYFTDDDIEEFLDIGKIKKFDKIIQTIDNYMSKNKSFYITSFTESQSSLSSPHMNDYFKDFYFYFLSNINFSSTSNTNFLGIHPLLIHFLYLYQIKGLEIGRINEKMEELKIELASIPNVKEDEIKKYIEEKLFLENKSKFRGIMKYYSTFNTWNDEIYYFLELVKKDEFDYFINSKNDELLYQAIGYLVYSLSRNLDTNEKLQIIYSTFHYFIFNKDLISSKNIKEQILKRLENNDSFSEIDKEIGHKYITSDFPDNHTNKFDIDSENKEIETISFEDLAKKNMESKLKN